MKKAAWVGVAVAIAVAGAWGYGALVRQENDLTNRVRLLAIAEEEPTVVSFSRSGRIVTRVPDEGEAIAAGDVVARLEEPGLTEEILDYRKQRAEIDAREQARQHEVQRDRAQLAQIESQQKRLARLVREGIAPSADLEALDHQREAIESGIQARLADKDLLSAQDGVLEVRAKKIEHFVKEGTLLASETGTVLTRHHRQGEWVTPGEPVLTLQVRMPYLRVEVPEERLSAFPINGSVRVWPQARPVAAFSARVVSIKPRLAWADRRNWGLQSRDLKTFSVRLKPEETATVIAGQTFVVEAGRI